jgi:hypothetical protein
MFLRAGGAEVHLLGRSGDSLAFARSLGFPDAWTADSLPHLPFDAVVDASNAPHLPARAVDLVEPAGRVVCIGLAGTPSTVDTRTLALKDVTLVGVLSASPGLAATIEAYASGAVDPRPLVAATVGSDRTGRPACAGAHTATWTTSSAHRQTEFLTSEKPSGVRVSHRAAVGPHCSWGVVRRLGLNCSHSALCEPSRVLCRSHTGRGSGWDAVIAA